MNETHDWAARGAAPGPSRQGHAGRMLRWGIGITVAGFLVGGGIAWAVSAGTAPAAATAAAAGSAPAGAARAAVLNSALASVDGSAATVPRPRLRWALARLRALGGVAGEVTFHNKTGFHTLAFERGTVASAAGGSVVIRAADGTTWTWLLVSDTVVRRDGSKTTTGALSPGEAVFAAGPVAGGARDARVIVIRPGASGHGRTAAGSAGTSTS
jgi:hypothetical protein